MSLSPQTIHQAYEAFGLTKPQDRQQVIINLIKFANDWGFDQFCRYMKFVKKVQNYLLVNRINESVVKLVVIAPRLMSNSGHAISIWDFYSDSVSGSYVWRNNRSIIFQALEGDFCVVPLRKEHILVPKPVMPADYDYGVLQQQRNAAQDAIIWQPDSNFYQGRHAPYCHLDIHLDISRIRQQPIWPITPEVVKQIFYRPQAIVPSSSVFPMLVAGALCKTKDDLAYRRPSL